MLEAAIIESQTSLKIPRNKTLLNFVIYIGM